MESVSTAMPVHQVVIAGSSTSPYATGGMIGGQGGQYHDFYPGAQNVGNVDGRTVAKFEMWAGEWQIRGIRITLTDGSSQLFGNAQGTYNQYSFQPGELIRNLSLWGNGMGTRSGRIKFTTSTGNTFDHGMTGKGEKTEYPMPCYSGIFVGIVVRSGSDTDALGCVFFKPLRSIVFTDISYPDLPSYEAAIQPLTIDVYKDTNSGTQARNWKWSKTIREEDERSWSATQGFELSNSLVISAGFPSIAEVSTTFSWTISKSSTQGATEKVETVFIIDQSGTLNPGQSVHLAAITRRGTLVEIPYTGKVTINLRNGESYTGPISGFYSGVAYTSVTIQDLVTGSTIAVYAPQPAKAELPAS